MKKYKDFKEYMDDNYYDDIARRLGSYIVAHKDSFENDEFHKITWIEQYDITYTVWIGYNKLDRFFKVI